MNRIQNLKNYQYSLSYQDFKVALSERRAQKLINKPTCKRSKIYEEDLVTFQLQRETVEMNKPRYIGQAILDISKVGFSTFIQNLFIKDLRYFSSYYTDNKVETLFQVIMYKFHYNFIMKHFPESKLLFTDTDSFCYLIPTEINLYDYML